MIVLCFVVIVGVVVVFGLDSTQVNSSQLKSTKLTLGLIVQQ